MAKTDNRPWAFDDCPQWKQFREAANAAGLRFLIMDEWTTHNSRFRGSDVHQYSVYFASPGADRRHLVTSMIVIGHAGDGFHLYLCDERLEFEPTIEALVERGKAREAMFA